MSINKFILLNEKKYIKINKWIEKLNNQKIILLNRIAFIDKKISELKIELEKIR